MALPRQVNILEAKNQLSRLVKAAQAGEEVVIAHRGVPAVRLVPIEPRPDRELDPIEWLEAHPLAAFLRRTPEKIEADLRAHERRKTSRRRPGFRPEHPG